MVLAAGYGERMLPVTRVLPKPLIPVLGRPLAPQVLSQLAIDGIGEVVINLHHLPQLLKNAFGPPESLGLDALHFSLEEDRILGTAGGLRHAEELLRGAGPILVRNSDFLADISLDRVVEAHVQSGCEATLVLAPHRAGYTPVTIDDRGRVTSFGGAAGSGHLFTGYHVIEESVLDLIPTGRPSDIVRDVYVSLAAAGKLNSYTHEGFWWEFGDPRSYLAGSLRLIGLSSEARATLGDFDVVRATSDAVVAVGAGVDLTAPGIKLTGALAIGMGVMVGENAHLEDTVVMPEAWVGPGSRLSQCIVGPGTEIPHGFESQRAMIVTDPDPAAELPSGMERAAGLIVRKIEGEIR